MAAAADPALFGPIAPLSADALAPVVGTEGAAVTIQTMPNGTRVSYRADGTPLRQWNPDGSVLTFDDKGEPAVQTFPDGSRWTFQPDGTVTETLPDRTAVDLEATAPPSSGITPDHIAFDSFDGRGQPLRGTLPDGTLVRYEYQPNGDVVVRYSTGLVQVEDATGELRWEKLSDGTTYTSFDSHGRPVIGADPDGRAFSLSYDARGGVSQRFTDGSDIEFDAGGRAVRQTAADGTVFTGFDGDGRPTRGVMPGGGSFSLSYDADGDTVQRLPDGTVIEFDAGGRAVRQTMADGTVFTAFDGRGRPTDGAAADGRHFTITYDSDGDLRQHLDDGTVIETDPNGKPIRTWNPDGTQITWAVDIPALGNAARQVAAERDSIRNDVASLKAAFAEMETMWDSPAGASLRSYADTFNRAADELVQVLDDAVTRMNSSYNNYVATENTNVGNLH